MSRSDFVLSEIENELKNPNRQKDQFTADLDALINETRMGYKEATAPAGTPAEAIQLQPAEESTPGIFTGIPYNDKEITPFIPAEDMEHTEDPRMAMINAGINDSEQPIQLDDAPNPFLRALEMAAPETQADPRMDIVNSNMDPFQLSMGDSERQQMDQIASQLPEPTDSLYNQADKAMGGALPFGQPMIREEKMPGLEEFEGGTPEAPVVFPDDPVMKDLARGIGGVATTAGGIANWAGKKDMAAGFNQFGEKLIEENQLTPGTPGEGGIGHKAIESLPFMATLLPLSILGAAGATAAAGALGLGAIGTGVAGVAGSVALSRPLESLMEAGGVYGDAMKQGMDEEQAAAAAKEVFLKNLPLGAADFLELGAAFLGAKYLPKPLREALEGALESRFGRNVLNTATKIAVPVLMEGQEENLQQIAQQQALGDRRGTIEQVMNPTQAQQEATKIGGLMGGLFGGAGIVTDLNPQVQEQPIPGSVPVQEKTPPTPEQQVESLLLQQQEEGITGPALGNIDPVQNIIDQAVSELTQPAAIPPQATESPVADETDQGGMNVPAGEEKSYQAVQDEIDTFEDMLSKKYGEEEVMGAPAYDSTGAFKDLEGINHITGQKTKISSEELDALRTLYKQRDEIGKKEDNAVLDNAMSLMPKEGPASAEMVKGSLQEMMKDKRLADVFDHKEASSVEDMARKIYNSLSHGLAAKGELPDAFAGDFDLALETAANFENSPYGQNPAPLLKQVKGIIDGLFGSGASEKTNLNKLLPAAQPKDTTTDSIVKTLSEQADKMTDPKALLGIAQRIRSRGASAAIGNGTKEEKQEIGRQAKEAADRIEARAKGLEQGATDKNVPKPEAKAESYATGAFVDSVISAMIRDGEIASAENIEGAFDAFFNEEYSDKQITNGFKPKGYREVLDELYDYYKSPEGLKDIITRAQKTLEAKAPENKPKEDSSLQTGGRGGKIDIQNTNIETPSQAPAVEVELEHTGSTVTVKTERGTSIEVKYALVSADDLIASHNIDLSKNEAYPEELQPRQRERAASEDQINRIAANLEPEFLGESPKASEGAPITGPDMVVESGNGRVISLQRVYKNKKANADKYRSWLSENAEKFGLKKADIEQVENPILVRVRQTEVDRVKFAQEANEQSVASMSATEQAKADATKLTGEILNLFVPSETGEIHRLANADFIRGFMDKVVGPAERGRYITGDGVLSQEGVTRIKNAIFAKAYGDVSAIATLAESTDNNVKNITNAMLIAAPKLAKVKEGIDQGNLHDLDISGDIAAAMKKLSHLRDTGDTVEGYLGQAELFGQELSDISRDLLNTFNENKRHTKKLAELLKNYADSVFAVGDPKQVTILSNAVPTKAELLLAAIRKVAKEYGEDADQATLFQDQAVRGETGGKSAGEIPERAGTRAEKAVKTKANKPGISDFGEKIGGAKKDRWSERNLTEEDLAELTDREADKFVTKDNIWKKMDYAQMVEDGMEPHVAYLIKKIHDALPAKVQPTTNEAKNKVNRENYIEFVGYVRDAVAEVKTEADLIKRKLFDKILVENGYYEQPASGRGSWTEKGKANSGIINKLQKEVQIDSWDIASAKRKVASTGFPGKVETWRKNIHIRHSSQGDWFITKDSRILADDFKTEEEAKAYLENELKDKLKTDKPKEPVIPQLAHIERTGKDYRKGKDATGQMLLDTFGFRGGEFGNWNSQAERQASLNYAYDGLMDLAEALGIKPKDISLNGQLGIAFGARGSGRALAHYEPSKIVINLTKMKGAGSLAHEWFHAVDDYLGRLSGNTTKLYSEGETRGASKLPEKVSKAFSNLKDAVLKAEKTAEEIIAEQEKDIQRSAGQVGYYTDPYVKRMESESDKAKAAKYIEAIKTNEDAEKNLQALSDLLKAKTGRVINKEDRNQIGIWARHIGYSQKRIEEAKAGEAKGKKDSNFYRSAKAIDRATRSTSYWAKIEEMLARAFAAYAQDMIPHKSQYLVHSANNGAYGELNPYPAGQERTDISLAFAGFFNALVDDGVMGKGSALDEKIEETFNEAKAEIDIKEAREAVKAMDPLFTTEETPDGPVLLYSGIPLDKLVESVGIAARDLGDKLGMPVNGAQAKGVKITQRPEAKEPGLITPLKSPTAVARNFPQAKPYVEDGIEATETQERLRSLFNKRLAYIDKVLAGGKSRLQDPLRNTYKRNKTDLQEILLTGDLMGKKFTDAELRAEFGVDSAVITAYHLTRAAYDHAHKLASTARELRGKDPVAYREGYIPHYFHDWFIMADGKLIGSARTMREAIEMANPLARKGIEIHIFPKQFQFPGADIQAAVIGDISYFKLKDKVEKDFGISHEDAKDLLEGVARMKGRSRFVGNFMQRKGADGWEKNLDWVNRHYFGMVSRYIALDRFKSKSIRRYERQFGAFDNEKKGLARYLKDYINDVNGTPTQIEDLINNTLAKVPALSQFLGKYLGNRPALQLASMTTNAVAIAKLGMFNVSSALVNATQLINTYSKLGERRTAQGLMKVARLSAKDKGVLKQLGVETQLGMESGAGYSRAAQMGRLFRGSTIIFQTVERELRSVAGLGAYYKGISEGKSHKEAIVYAKEIIKITNYDYSIADTPAFIRRSGPLGQVLFQFKKYPVKTLEFIGQLHGAEHARFWIPLIVIGGYYSFPGMQLLMNLIKGLFDYDPELEAKKYLMEWAGANKERQNIAKAILYGAFGPLGADISKRVGMGDFIPAEIGDFSGPFFSTIVRAAQLAAKREWVECLRAISPAPGNLLLSTMNDGEITSPWSRDRLKARLTTGDRVLKALGFMPTAESIETDKSRLIYYSEDKVKAEEQRVIDSFIKAAKEGDKPKLLEATKRVLELGITVERIQTEADKKNTLPSERTLDTVPKKRKGDYTEIDQFQ